MDRYIVFIFIILLHAAASIKLWDDLRIKFSIPEAAGFHRVGRTLTSALKDDNWRAAQPSTCVTETDSGSGKFYGYQVLNKENSVALLYDVKGSIAGMQTLYRHKEFVIPKNPYRFDSVPIFQNLTLDGEKYLILTAYFVNPETICETGRAEVAMEAEGTGDGLWVQNGSSPASSALIPFNRKIAQKKDWSEQNCFPGMGWHNFYKTDGLDAKNCVDFFPIFLLFNSKEEMIGFGFNVFGRPHGNSIFESPPPGSIKIVVRDPVPQCLLDLDVAIGTSSLHVYFVDKPWDIPCP